MTIQEAIQLALSALKTLEDFPAGIQLSEAELREGFWYITLSYQLIEWTYPYKILFFRPIRKLKSKKQEFKIFSINTKTKQIEALATFSEPRSEFILIEEN